MIVKLLNKDIDYELTKMVTAARICYGSESDNLGDNDMKLLTRLARLGHETPFEQGTFTFVVKGVSRALLQELVRHRIQSLNVRSTRFTINKLVEDYGYRDYNKYFVSVDDFVDSVNAMNVENVISQIREESLENNVKNDKIKYLFPETLKTQLISTMNLRSLSNFFKLRRSKAALWEIRELADKMYNLLDERVKDIIREINK